MLQHAPGSLCRYCSKAVSALTWIVIWPSWPQDRRRERMQNIMPSVVYLSSRDHIACCNASFKRSNKGHRRTHSKKSRGMGHRHRCHAKASPDSVKPIEAKNDKEPSNLSFLVNPTPSYMWPVAWSQSCFTTIKVRRLL